MEGNGGPPSLRANPASWGFPDTVYVPWKQWDGGGGGKGRMEVQNTMDRQRMQVEHASASGEFNARETHLPDMEKHSNCREASLAANREHVRITRDQLQYDRNASRAGPDEPMRLLERCEAAAAEAKRKLAATSYTPA